MRVHAYSELYLSDAQRSLATAFDYAINDCHLSPDVFAGFFESSIEGKQFERGNPSFVSGRSGIELAMCVLSKKYPDLNLPKPTNHFDCSPEYWAGWAFAYYQWDSSKRFKTIFEKVPLSEIISMYRVFHEMDITNFIEEIDKRINSRISDTKRKVMRNARGLSQQELADLSGVKVRSIQLYEQRINDIDKAQAHTLYKLSVVLDCDIEDLLEEPETVK